MRSEEEIRASIALLSVLEIAADQVPSITNWIRALRWVLGEYPPQPPAPVELVHGVNCPKAPHGVRGLGHLESDDKPFLKDDVLYCGRCHEVLNRS